MMRRSAERDPCGGQMDYTKLFSYGMVVALAGMLLFTIVGSGELLLNRN